MWLLIHAGIKVYPYKQTWALLVYTVDAIKARMGNNIQLFGGYNYLFMTYIWW